MRRLLLTLTLFLLLPGSASAAWQWPVSGDVITPYRNGTDPYASGQHRGIDIAAPVGAAVRAAFAGEVRFAGTAGTSGLTVSVRTGDGYDTSYLHLSSVSVRAGTRVSAGARLGAVGTTGTRSAAAPHLHFGVRTAESRHAYHDPLRFLPPPPAASRPPAAPPAPAPEPAPAPPAPAPAPVPGAAPRARDAPRPAPFGRRAPRPAPIGRRVPRPVPTGRRVPHRTPVAQRAPRAAPAPTGSPGPADAPAHRRTPSPSPNAERRHSPAATPLAPRALRPAPAGDHGPNLGWALACAGLLLAAGLLGLTEDGRRGTRRTRARVAGALRPLLGRR